MKQRDLSKFKPKEGTVSSTIEVGGNSPRSYRSESAYAWAIVDNLEDELMVIDREFRVIEVNTVLLLRHGKRRDEVIGRHCYKVSHGLSKPCGPPQHECPVVLALQSGKPARVTHVHSYYHKGENKVSYVDIIASPIRDNKDNVIAVVELMRDVTQSKESELEIAKLHEELLRKDRTRGELINELISIQEEERKRIARELHDETGQVLASLSANLEAAIGMLPANAEKPITLIRKAQTISVKLLDDIHRLIYQLRPAVLDDFGLVDATRWLVDNSLSTVGISVVFKTTGQQRRLIPQLETTLFRVIQEASTNIIRHALAKNVRIILRFKKKSIEVSIKDDGKGFDVEEAISSNERPRGLGLLGMKERIELMHGTVNIRSQPGCGTEIDIESPG